VGGMENAIQALPPCTTRSEPQEDLAIPTGLTPGGTCQTARVARGTLNGPVIAALPPDPVFPNPAPPPYPTSQAPPFCPFANSGGFEEIFCKAISHNCFFSRPQFAISSLTVFLGELPGLFLKARVITAPSPEKCTPSWPFFP